MNKKIIICGVIVAAGLQMQSVAYASLIGDAGIGTGTGGGQTIVATSCTNTTCTYDAYVLSLSNISCTSYSTERCFKQGDTVYKIKNCTSCDSGYTLTEFDTTVSCNGVRKKYTGCDTTCNTSTNCKSDTTWSSAGTGYQKKATRTCDTSTNQCITSTTYRCASGYYGSSTNGTSGCSQCPEWSGVYTNSARTTLARGVNTVGDTTITSCFVPSGTYYDLTGTLIINGSNCWYKQ